MAVERISESDARLTDLLSRARQEPLILRTGANDEFALLPLDEDVLDLLLERNPKLIAECREIDARMQQGDYLTHDQVLQALREDEPG
jgi:hypothetical protein